MFVTSYAETLWFWIIKGILPSYVSDPKMHLGFCHAFRVLESCRNMKSSEESNCFVTMLMLRTEWQRNKLNMHKLCKQYLRWKASAWRNPGNLAAFIFEKLSRKKPSKIHPSRPLIGYRITGRLFLPPFPLQGSIPVFVIKMEFKNGISNISSPNCDLSAHALPMFREPRQRSTRKQLEKDRLDPMKSHKPEPPVAGPGNPGIIIWGCCMPKEPSCLSSTLIQICIQTFWVVTLLHMYGHCKTLVFDWSGYLQ